MVLEFVKHASESVPAFIFEPDWLRPGAHPHALVWGTADTFGVKSSAEETMGT